MPVYRINALLDKTGDHQRNRPTKDANGGDVVSYVTINASVKFSAYPLDTQLIQDYARRDIVVDTAIACAVDLDAKPRDRISSGGVYYIVQGLEPYSNTFLQPNPVYIMHCQRRVN